MQFNFAATITSIWNGTVASHSGTKYVINNAGYNSTIAPGQSVTIGFRAARAAYPAAADELSAQRVADHSDRHLRRAPVQATATFADVNDWGTGFTGNITITNTGTTAIIGWTLSL